jgi:hypothetical protein
MERYGRDFADVARSLGYESSRHASDAFKFHTGYAAMTVLRSQGFEGILEEFVRRLGAADRLPSLAATLNATSYLHISA